MLNSRLPLLLPLARGFIRHQTLLNGLKVPSSSTNLKILSFEQNRGYKNFGHKPEREPLISRIFMLFLLSGVLATMVDWRWCRMLFLHFTGQLKKKNEVTENPDQTSVEKKS